MKKVLVLGMMMVYGLTVLTMEPPSYGSSCEGQLDQLAQDFSLLVYNIKLCVWLDQQTQSSRKLYQKIDINSLDKEYAMYFTFWVDPDVVIEKKKMMLATWQKNPNQKEEAIKNEFQLLEREWYEHKKNIELVVFKHESLFREEKELLIKLVKARAPLYFVK